MKKNNLHLFNSNLNNKYKSAPFITRTNDTGEVRPYPTVSKEWKNTIYSYYKNNMKDLAVNNLNANKVIQNYFNLYFKENFVDARVVDSNRKRNSLKRIYASQLETKHTNSKIIMTLYTMNIGQGKMYRDYVFSMHRIYILISKFFKKNLRKKIKFLMKTSKLNLNKNNLVLEKYKNIEDKKNLFMFKYKLLNESLKWYNLYLKLYITRAMKFAFYSKLMRLRKYQYDYNLNRLKFDQQGFLHNLSILLSRLYKNKIEFNLVNLKSVSLHPDFITQSLTLKIKRQNLFLLSEMRNMLKKAILPKVNKVVEKSGFIKKKNMFLHENVYKNSSLLSIMNLQEKEEQNCFLNNLLQETTNYSSQSFIEKYKANEDYNNISDLIFDSIKYKKLGGVRLEVRGRLTRRYRADRAVFKIKWKGGLKDIDSSYKGLPIVTYRGYDKPNLSYSLSSSKRRVGAFAVKGWISGK